MPKLVLIDFDDTITDSILADFHSFREALSFNEFKRLRKKGFLAKDIAQKILENRERKLSRYHHKIRLNKRLINFIRTLRREGYVIIITTNRHRNFVRKIIKKYRIDKLFNEVYTRDKNNKRGIIDLKKSMYQRAIKKYRVDKKDISVIGNLPEDLIPAQMLGIKNLIMVKSNYSRKKRDKIWASLKDFRKIKL